VRSLEDLPAFVATRARKGDLIITMGAGSIGAIGDRILAAIRTRDESAAATGGRS
jgi:UDP-N-acetylmuramate--alanine ligase